MNPFFCVLPFNFEEIFAQITSDEGVEVKSYVFLILTDPKYMTRSSKFLDNSKHQYPSMEQMVNFVKLTKAEMRNGAHMHMSWSSSKFHTWVKNVLIEINNPCIERLDHMSVLDSAFHFLREGVPRVYMIKQVYYQKQGSFLRPFLVT